MTVSGTTTRKRERVASYLREELDESPVYVKSKFLADDLDLTSKEIGGVLGRLADADTDLQVEKWSYTNATTWRVQRD